MLYHQQNLKIPCVNIVSKKMTLHTICTNKNGLSLIDRKRYWYEDNTSHGFGYHKLPKISPSNNSLIPSKNRPSHNINHILPFSMNYRRGLNNVFESEHPKSGLYHIDKWFFFSFFTVATGRISMFSDHQGEEVTHEGRVYSIMRDDILSRSSPKHIRFPKNQPYKSNRNRKWIWSLWQK